MKESFTWIATLLAVMWGIELVNLLSKHRLSRTAAIHPRTLHGLFGIPVSPFLHFSVSHLLTNTLPFALLGVLIRLQGKMLFIEVSLLIIAVSGFMVWLLGRAAAHAGASALIFGYFGFLLAAGLYAKDLQAMLIALGVLIYYGGMMSGVLPLRAYVSWEGHLFGFLSGILAAKMDVWL